MAASSPSRTASVAEYLKYYSATQTFSNALSPVQAAVVLTAVEIVRSEEGKRRRRALMDNILYMRSEMTKVGLEALGDPSAIVPVRVGAEGLARIASRELASLGAIANLVEYPAVPQGGARFRVQVMADHTREDVDLLVRSDAEAMRSADLEYRSYREAEAAFGTTRSGQLGRRIQRGLRHEVDMPMITSSGTVLRLLAVDDDASSAELIVRVAERCGYEAFATSDSRGVINLVKAL